MQIFKRFFLLFSITISLKVVYSQKYGALAQVPDADNLQYRLGNGLGYIGNGWDDAKMSNLSSKAGYDVQRK